MKTITVPADVLLTDLLTGVTGETITFQAWAFGRWMNDQAAADSIVKLCRWIKVVDKFKAAAKPGDTIELEDEDYATLLPIVERAATAVPPMVAAQLLPFHDAVINAT